MIYELRVYTIYPGKMEDIHKRFREKTLNLFKKQGMEVIDFWEDIEGRNKLYYVMEHPDIDTRNRNFEAFLNDPEWIETRDLSELNGPIVEKVDYFFMKRVPYIKTE